MRLLRRQRKALVAPKPRIAVVSPFVDKQHGTEMCVAELLERLAGEYEIHLYSSRVEDLDLSQIHWHRVPALPAPHVVKYVWWLAANSVVRWWNGMYRRSRADLVYSPGINCLDADIIAVHIVFGEFQQRVEKTNRLLSNPVASWPLLIHRRIYYGLAKVLERWVYTWPDVSLVAVSKKVAADLNRFYMRQENLQLIYHGCDVKRFNARRRHDLRERARSEFGLRQEEFAILLIGNDWKKKGLNCLLEAVARLANRRFRILVVGEDDISPYQSFLELNNLADRVQFLPLRRDVERYYAAADLYAGPSLEDAFALPPLEAMACELPVIVSRQAGVSEIIHHGEDGLVLEDPGDARTLTEWIRRLADDVDFLRTIATNAARTAAEYTWERNASQTRDLIERVRIGRHPGIPTGRSE
jgi:UDP-glucose:(heptosyl)LPS alpha-1,3-glucosyltransferase